MEVPSSEHLKISLDLLNMLAISLVKSNWQWGTQNLINNMTLLIFLIYSFMMQFLTQMKAPLFEVKCLKMSAQLQ